MEKVERFILGNSGESVLNDAVNTSCLPFKQSLATQLDGPMGFHRGRNQVAMRVAMRRAAHQLLDVPLIFDDPLAIRILGQEDSQHLRQNLEQMESNEMARKLRAFFVVRSRYVEDVLATADASQVHQYVICGAGLDTSAYRCANKMLRVFEMDHPETQRWKKECLNAAAIPIPNQLAFVAIDFEKEAIEEKLCYAGFNTSVPSLFSLLGLIPYLPADRAMAIFYFIASSAAPGTKIVFDYVPSPCSLTQRQKLIIEVLQERVESVGAPWKSSFDPKSLVNDLEKMGYTDVQELDGEKLNALYCNSREDDLRVGRLARLIAASLPKEESGA